MSDRHRDIIVIGASAGGLEAILAVIQELPPDLPAAIFLVQHVAAFAESLLPEIINHKSTFPAAQARHEAPIEPGRIYIAPPDHHLLVEHGRMLVTKGPKENLFRPSIDALFRSAAYTYRERVIGIILSGMLNDGTSGMWMVKRQGGLAIIQQPDEARYDSMPRSVQEYVAVDYTLPARDIGGLLQALVGEPSSEQAAASAAEEDRLKLEISYAKNEKPADMDILDKGIPSSFVCPDCHGALTQINEDGIVRFRCYTGHAFSPEALLAGFNENIEKDMWQVVRGLMERLRLLEKLGETLKAAGNRAQAEELLEQTRVIEEKIRGLQQVLKG